MAWVFTPPAGKLPDVGDLGTYHYCGFHRYLRDRKRTDVISNDRIKAGDVVVGLSSSGQATYEREYNRGMGSNGLTSARHDVFNKTIAQKFPESYDPSVPQELVFSGKKR